MEDVEVASIERESRKMGLRWVLVTVISVVEEGSKTHEEVAK
jgi:hypothetical protein